MGDLGKELRIEFGKDGDNIAWDMVGDRAHDFYHNEIYRTAADLLDSGEDVDLNNEYHRGLTELVARFTGATADHLGEVSKGISAHTRDLKFYAGEWCREHGTVRYDDIDDDIQQWGIVEHSRSFDEDELQVIRDLIDSARIVF